MEWTRAKAASAAHRCGASKNLEKAISGKSLLSSEGPEPLINENEVFFQPPDIEDDGTHARWADEVVVYLGQVTARLLARSRVVQILVAATVLVDLCVSVYTIIDDDVNDEISLRIVSVLILCVLVFDITIRLIAHRAAFFYSGINDLELVIVILCLLEIIVRNLLPINASIGRLCRPVARFLKISSSALKVFGVNRRVKMRVDQLADTLTDDLLEKALGDVIYISPENATAQPTEGRFLIEKTHFLPGAFANIHAPVTIKGGFIELIYVDADLKTPSWNMPSWGKDNAGRSSREDLGAPAPGGGIGKRLSNFGASVTEKVTARKRDRAEKHGSGVIVVCKNILLVVGPGHHERSSGLGSWDFDEVVCQKDRLVELFASRVEMLTGGKKKKKKVPTGPPPPKKPPQQSGVMGGMGQIRDLLFSGWGSTANIKHVSIDVLSVEVRYEDFDLLPRPVSDGGARGDMAQLMKGSQPKGPNMPVSIGFKIGEFRLRLEGGPTSPLDHPLFRAHAAWNQGAAIAHVEDDGATADGALADEKKKGSPTPPGSPPESGRGLLMHAGHSAAASSTSLGASSDDKPPLRLAIRLVRVSSWLDHDVQKTSCFTPFFSESPIQIKGAVQLFQRLQIFERLKMAAIEAVEQEASKDEEGSQPTSTSGVATQSHATGGSVLTQNAAGTGKEPRKVKLRMQRFREMVMPHYFILSPTVVSVHMLTLEPPEPGDEKPAKKRIPLPKVDLATIPGDPLKRKDVAARREGRKKTATSWEGQRPGHAIDVDIPKLNVQIDPWQVHGLLLLNSYFVQWVKHDNALSRRPILRPGEVPLHHGENMHHGDEERAHEWSTEVELHRKTVIRSWWVYAAHAIAANIAPNGKLETFLELRRRARCRRVYIASLMTKHRSEHLQKMTLHHLPINLSFFGVSSGTDSASSTVTKEAVKRNVEALRENGSAPSPKDASNKSISSKYRKMDSSLNSSSVDLLRLMDAAEKRPQDFIWNGDMEYALREMQVTLPFKDILMARMVAKQRHEDEKRGVAAETAHAEIARLSSPDTSPRPDLPDNLPSSTSIAVEDEVQEKPPPKAETSQISLKIGNVTTAFLDPPSGDKEVKLRRQQVRAFVRNTSLVFTQGSPASEWPRLTRRPAGVVNRGQMGATSMEEAVFNALPGQSSPPITDATAATSGWIAVELAVGAFGVLYVQAPQEVPTLRVVLQQLPAPKGILQQQLSDKAKASAGLPPPPSSSSADCPVEAVNSEGMPVAQAAEASGRGAFDGSWGQGKAPMVVVRLVSWHEDPPPDEEVVPINSRSPSQEFLDGAGADGAGDDTDLCSSAASQSRIPPKFRQNILLAFICPLEVVGYKPLIAKLGAAFKAPMGRIPEDNLDFAGARRDLQGKRAVRNSIKVMSRGFEKATGFTLGSNAQRNMGMRFVISQGSVRATTVEQFTTERLLIHRVDLPSNTEAFSSNEIPPFFDVGMRLQSLSSGILSGGPITADFNPSAPIEVASAAVKDEAAEAFPRLHSFGGTQVGQFSTTDETYQGQTVSTLRAVKDSPFRWMSSLFATSCSKLPASCAEVPCNGNMIGQRTISNDGPDMGDGAGHIPTVSAAADHLTDIPVVTVPIRSSGAPWMDSKAVNVRIKCAKFGTLEREILRLNQVEGLDPQNVQEPKQAVAREQDKVDEA